MPYRKTPFGESCYYHVYNRGVEKRQIFMDEADYSTFIDIIHYFAKPRRGDKERPVLSARTGLSGLGLFEKEITILAYCLMPNHFHFLFYQTMKDSISRFMKRICLTYATYFNQKYDRVGALYQGRFKAKFIETDEYLLHLSRYIHANPREVLEGSGLSNYPWSSYPEYLGMRLRGQGLSDPKIVLSYFSQTSPSFSYQSFVEELEIDRKLIKDYIFE